jgi:tetratricopeptide (TPR) repeat protein
MTFVLRRVLVVALLLSGVAGASTYWVPLHRALATPLLPAEPSPYATAPLPLKLFEAARALDSGDSAKARDLTRAFLKDEPRSALGHEFLGAVLLGRRELTEAEAEFSHALVLEPRRATAMLGLGRVAVAKGELVRGASAFRSALAIDPLLVAARRDLAVVLLRQHQVAQAVAELNENVRITQGQDRVARYLLASIAYEVGRLGEAERLLAELGPSEGSGVSTLLALVELERSQAAAARSRLEKVIARDRTSPWGRLAAAVLERESGRTGPARTALEKLAAEKPDWAVAHFQLGVTLLRAGQPEAALQAFGKGEAVSSDPHIARVRVAQMLLAAGETERALAKARASLNSPTAGSLARSLIIQAYARAKNPDGAERDLQAAIAAAPKDAGPPMDLGRFYLGRGRPQDALGAFETAARLDTQSIEPVAGQVRALLALKQGARAASVVEGAIRVHPQSPDLHVLLASVQENQGKTKEAEGSYRKALELEPNHLLATLGLASIYERSRRGPEAVQLLEEAGRAHPRAPAPLTELAAVHVRAGNPKLAIAACQAALERDPTNAQIENNLAFLLSTDPKRLDEALRLAQSAHVRSPGSTTADTLGWILFLKGDVVRAEKLVAQAAAAEPDNAQIRYHLGKIFARQGRSVEARGALEQAIKIGGFAEIDDARQTLASLK